MLQLGILSLGKLHETTIVHPITYANWRSRFKPCHGDLKCNVGLRGLAKEAKGDVNAMLFILLFRR